MTPNLRKLSRMLHLVRKKYRTPQARLTRLYVLKGQVIDKPRAAKKVHANIRRLERQMGLPAA